MNKMIQCAMFVCGLMPGLLGAQVTPPAAQNPAMPADAGKSLDQPIYTDALVSGWINYGWAAFDANNATPARSGKSLKIASEGFDGLHLHHSDLDTSLYENLTFWIHGGAEGGQLVGVRAYLGGALQPEIVNLEPLAPDVWQEITIPLADIGAADQSNFNGIFFGNPDGTARPAYYVDDATLLAKTPPATTEITVDAGKVLQTLDDRLFALNTGAFQDHFLSHATFLDELGVKTLRFPGGTLSDTYQWSTGSTKSLTGEVRDWGLKFDAFAKGAQDAKAQVFITVNYGTGTPEDAAAWVKYSNVTKGYGFKYWEIGNESNLSAEPDTNVRPHDPYTYAMRAKDYITQMKAVDPTIKIGVVISGNETSQDNGYTDHAATNPRTGEESNGWTPVLLTTLKSQGVIPDFVVHHRYVYLGDQEHDLSLLLSSKAWKTEMAHIRQMLTDYLGTDAAKIEITVTEHNSTASQPAKQTTSLVNGLFLADSIGYAAQTEMKALVFWQMSDDAQNPGENPSLYGWRNYGGYGIMERVAATDPKFEVYPTFYIYKLLKHFARGGDSVVSTESNYAMLSAHAAVRADGSLSLLVINKHPTATYDTRIALKGYAPGKAAKVYSYGIPQDDAARTKTGSADVAQGAIDDAGVSFKYSFSPYSATVLSFTPAP